jgi:sulfur-oxidizing protein SoxZ
MLIRATLKGDTTHINVYLRHPMETGRRKNIEGEIVPQHFIKNVVVTHNGKTVVDAQWSQGVSRNPLFGLRIKGAKTGDKIAVSWVDSEGDTRSGEAAVTAAA